MNEYWLQDKAFFVIQPVGEYDECDDLLDRLRAIIAPLNAVTVLDYGCGCGRLSRLFATAGYLGYDPNRAAISHAMHANPCYDYTQHCPAMQHDLTFAYTVLLHLDDVDIEAWADAVRSKYVVIAEVMGRDWRRPGNPPVYNREPHEYVTLLGARGYALKAKHELPHNHYAGHYGHASTGVTVLVFERAQPHG